MAMLGWIDSLGFGASAALPAAIPIGHARGRRMQTYTDLAEAIWTQLENRPLYPLEELLANGLNPAMALLTLLRPTLLTRRVPAVLPAYSLTLDLRVVDARAHRVLRVLLGEHGGDIPQPTAGQFRPLLATTREALARLTPTWLHTLGVPRRWFPLGAHLLAVWPRPVVDVPLTLISAVIPPRATVDTQGMRTHLDAATDDELVDLAVAMLRIKEGSVETQQGLQKLVGLVAPPQRKGGVR
jgi:hypothetical protein